MAATSDANFLNPPPPPKLIQGGMGVGVSTWKLARAASIAGERRGTPVLGVVSGTGLSVLLVDRLQACEEDAIRALRAFHPQIAEEIINEYVPANGLPATGRCKLAPKPEVMVTGTPESKKKMTDLAVASAFVEVWLAKEGHDGPIAINVLEKVQLMHLPVLLGAMMAGADYVLVGAGIPHQIPAVLTSYAHGRPACYRLDVIGESEKHTMTLNPCEFMPERRELKRPKFLAIVSHHALAMRLATKVELDGFVIEGPTAGGHNAPARGKTLGADGQPVYGKRDEPDIAKLKELGKPFWRAGSRASSESLQASLDLGGAGIQVGSAFALCDESGLLPEIKKDMRARIAAGTLEVKTSATASPSGFPFQVVQFDGTLSDQSVYDSRRRICNLGHLVEAYRKDDEKGGGIGFRCPAEPIELFVRKGGAREDTEGRMCLCNGLGAAAGHGAIGGSEPIVLTLGKDLGFFREIASRPDGGYTADDVVGFILGNPDQSD